MISILYDIFKKWSEKGSVYIYSDPHFGDEECFQFRLKKNRNKFYLDAFPEDITTVKQLDRYQIDNINAVCHKNDTLIILGDVGDLECVKYLKAGHKVLITGNHDLGASNYKRQKMYDLNPVTNRYFVVSDNKLFDEVYSGPLMISDKIILSHEPLIPCPSYLVNLHGHVHDKDHINIVDRIRRYNFCAEAINYKPKSLGEMIKNGLLSNIDDIHRTTIDFAVERKTRRESGVIKD